MISPPYSTCTSMPSASMSARRWSRSAAPAAHSGLVAVWIGTPQPGPSWVGYSFEPISATHCPPERPAPRQPGCASASSVHASGSSLTCASESMTVPKPSPLNLTCASGSVAEMALQIHTDRERFLGSGTWAFHAPSTFDLDDEMKVIVVDPAGDPDDRIRLAVDGCPPLALAIAEERARAGHQRRPRRPPPD